MLMETLGPQAEPESSGTGLKCSCVIQYLAGDNEVLRSQQCKLVILDLGRNEVDDIVLKLSHTTGVLGPYTIREHTILKRFMKDGKATIILKPQKLQFLISNCPPDHLRGFLQSLSIKMAARGKIQGSHRRMLGDISLQFNEISPLNASDVESARKLANKDGASDLKGGRGRGGKENEVTTPCRQTGKKFVPQKRKLSDMSTSPSKPPRQSTVVTGGNPAKKPAFLSSSTTPISAEQARVLEMIKSGESVFFTGSAGTGKSHLLKRIIRSLPPDTTFPTASTGAAACLIGGTTLHAFAGMGIGSGDLEKCTTLASRDPYAASWRKCRCLVIDEISMVDAEFFDKMEGVARAVRKSREVFGGIQLVVCGDFLQLPPVSKESEKKKFCFEAKCWHSAITRSIELSEVYRQTDKQFVALLQNIRIGRCPPAAARILASTSGQTIERDGIRATKLYTHKGDVEATNSLELEALVGQVRQFQAQDSDPQLERTLDSMCPVGRTVDLKIGAQVMLAKNINVHRNLVNGARGVVKGFDPIKGHPVIRFASGLEEVIGPEKWSVRSGRGTYVSRRQLPLKLAWAISIHKSQGMTLDCVELSLSRCFEVGQAYVALSRARSLASLRVLDFHPSCVQAHPDVLEFYRCLRRTRRNHIQER